MSDKNTSVTEFRGLTEPVTKLIESISTGIGVLYEPIRIRRKAQADAEAILGDLYPGLCATPLCPKGAEIGQDCAHRLSNSVKTKEYFEQEMTKAFQAMNRCLAPEGVLVLVYAHKTTAAWETLVKAL